VCLQQIVEFVPTFFFCQIGRRAKLRRLGEGMARLPDRPPFQMVGTGRPLRRGSKAKTLIGRGSNNVSPHTNGRGLGRRRAGLPSIGRWLSDVPGMPRPGFRLGPNNQFVLGPHCKLTKVFATNCQVRSHCFSFVRVPRSGLALPANVDIMTDCYAPILA
jgi:hypothetical protein